MGNARSPRHQQWGVLVWDRTGGLYRSGSRSMGFKGKDITAAYSGTDSLTVKGEQRRRAERSPTLWMRSERQPGFVELQRLLQLSDDTARVRH